MRLALGLFLMFVGGAVMVAGIVLAVLKLASLYQGALDAPLDQPPGTEAAVETGMLHGVAFGAIGIVPFIIGSVLVKATIAQKIIRARAKRQQQAAQAAARDAGLREGYQDEYSTGERR